MFQKMQAIWKRATRQSRDQPQLDIGEGEVALFDHGEEIWRFRWADISRVETYKRDLFVVAMICLDLSDDARRVTYPTHGEMSGFDTLRERIRQRFPTIPENWERRNKPVWSSE